MSSFPGCLGAVFSASGETATAPASTFTTGQVTVVGKTYKAGGLEQGEEVLYDLARRPETARYLATKLARHFVVDEPTPDLVDRYNLLAHPAGSVNAIYLRRSTASAPSRAPTH